MEVGRGGGGGEREGQEGEKGWMDGWTERVAKGATARQRKKRERTNSQAHMLQVNARSKAILLSLRFVAWRVDDEPKRRKVKVGNLIPLDFANLANALSTVPGSAGGGLLMRLVRQESAPTMNLKREQGFLADNGSGSPSSDNRSTSPSYDHDSLMRSGKSKALEAVEAAAATKAKKKKKRSRAHPRSRPDAKKLNGASDEVEELFAKFLRACAFVRSRGATSLHPNAKLKLYALMIQVCCGEREREREKESLLSSRTQKERETHTDSLLLLYGRTDVRTQAQRGDCELADDDKDEDEDEDEVSFASSVTHNDESSSISLATSKDESSLAASSSTSNDSGSSNPKSPMAVAEMIKHRAWKAVRGKGRVQVRFVV